MKNPVMRKLSNLTTPCLLLGTFGLAGCYNYPAGDPFDPSGEPMRTKPTVSAAAASVGNGHETITAIVPFFDDNPRHYAELMVSDDSTPDDRVAGIARLSGYGFGQREPYTDAYATLASSGAADLVRAMAIRALNRSSESGRTQLLVDALGDESDLVRLEAAKALGNLPDSDAAGPLLQVASTGDENLDVRIAAVDALRHYPQNQEVVDRLIMMLAGDVFELVFQSRASLAVIFGWDLGYNADEWRAAVSSEPAA